MRPAGHQNPISSKISWQIKCSSCLSCTPFYNQAVLLNLNRFSGGHLHIRNSLSDPFTVADKLWCSQTLLFFFLQSDLLVPPLVEHSSTLPGCNFSKTMRTRCRLFPVFCAFRPRNLKCSPRLEHWVLPALCKSSCEILRWCVDKIDFLELLLLLFELSH